MRRQLAVFVALLCAMAARAENRGAVDWIFLVDTSKSMRANDVFREVQGSIKTFIAEANDGDSITIFTFDRDVLPHAMMDVRDGSREDLVHIVDTLEANGNRTHLGAAIEKGLERSEALMARGDPTRTRAIVLFTDGKEDVRGIPDPVPIEPSVQRALQSRPWMFFVSLGEHEQQLENFPNARVMRTSSAAEIRKLATGIREIVEPKPAVVTVTPRALRLGELDRGATAERELAITSDPPSTATIDIASTPGLTVIAPDHVLAPSRVTLKFAIDENAQPGERHVAIRVNGIVIPATVTINPPSLLFRIAKWLAALVLLALAVVVSLILRKQRNRLEGEIEIVQPNVGSDAAYVGLPRLETTEVALSTIVPPDALAGCDARLFCRHRDGRKRVWIAASSGSLRVNDVETPLSELYDADTIQIGAARLRFNRVGFERPQEDLA